jgi:hypothetical protein
MVYEECFRETFLFHGSELHMSSLTIVSVFIRRS